MLGLDGYALRITWTVFLLAGLLWMLYLLRGVLLVFILAVLFAYVIWPLVAITEKVLGRAVRARRAARLAALGVVYPALIGVAIVTGTVLAPRIAQEAATLYQRATAFAGEVQRGQRLVEIPVLRAIQDQLLQHAGDILPYLQKAGAELLRYLSNLWLVALVPILAFFLLKDAEKLAGSVENGFVRGLFADLHNLLAQYMRALILLSLLSFASHLVFFLLAGAPYALLLATLAGMLEFIPMVGPLAAAVTILLASWLAGYEHLVWILIFLGVWRLIQDYVNMPWLLGAGVELHPLLVIFGILAGAELAGVAGMFLSVPIVAALRILVRRGLAQARAAP